MFWIILTTLILTLIIRKFYLRPFSLWKDMGVPQVNPVILFGDSWPMMLRWKNLPEWMDWVYYRHPESKCIGIYLPNMPLLVLRDPELIKQLAVKDFDYFTDHNIFSVPEEIDFLWSNNLFSLKGQAWKDMRALLSRSFTSSKMRLVYELIFEESVKFTQYFKNKNEQTMDLELKDCFSRFTTDVIASTAFGIKVDSLDSPDNEFLQMGKKISNFDCPPFILRLILIYISPWLFKFFGLRFLSRTAAEYFTSSIKKTIKIREEQNIIRPDMINSLLEIKNKKIGKTAEENELVLDTGFAIVQETKTGNQKQPTITDMDIASQAIAFFIGGFESISKTICFTCYELAVNPEVQHKLREEIKDTYKKTNGKPSYENILGMKYLDMVITESLRKWPVAPIADRICVKPYTLEPKEVGDPKVIFQPGHTLLIPIHSIHNDPKNYPTPEKFIPERFSDENKCNIKPYTYLPFGVGPRTCIGIRFALLEIKSVLFHLLHSFAILPTEKTKIPLRICKIGLNYLPEGKFPLAFKRI